MRVAVTGASGFLGRHVVRHLGQAGHDVVPLGRAADGSGLTVLDGGSRAQRSTPLSELLDGVDAVVHLAARKVDDPATPLAGYLGPNVVLTEDLLRAAVDAGVRRFVLASSRMVYPSWLTGPLREDCPHPPDTAYGLSKRTAEDLLRLTTARTSLAGLALRIGQVVGTDGGGGVLPRLIDRARTGGPLEVTGKGVAVRDFVDVVDVAHAFVLAVQADAAVPVVNVGGPAPRSIADLARTVAVVAGLGEGAVVHVPADDEDTSHYSLDRSLARDALGWEPRRTLEETIRGRLEGPA
ncbi:MAG TPA: NAD(P)-dependent oxidoreductase [Mycobacteriales bacterium]|nr:NAD(P)-dependent oxidoreductase [Mycobacteriales bacterium]